ncbi:hypothetical protein MNBD_GAMMA03-363 [hydrothermal vent metagenome]|uniref:Uncharacterized protein n=1 Tax=hydrothermal vent metagenome TaxID=652676 RepID=A0A3B0W6C5_9ZZZZ
MRAIIFLLFVILVFLIIRFTLNRIIEIRAKNAPIKQEGLTTEEQNKSEAMVQCALCGVHLPQSIAYFDGKDTFCSEGHMQEFQENSHK